MKLSAGEARLFGKYYGQEFLSQDGFWADVLAWLGPEGTNIAVPYNYNPTTVRMAHDMLQCPKGKCSLCCCYPQVPVEEHDLKRLTRAGFTLGEYQMGTREDGVRYINAKGGCPFLKDNLCSVYAFRPDACWLFPVQRSVGNDGMELRVKCEPGLAVAKQIFIEAQHNNLLVLPTLRCVQREA